jgi:hypothetical protein
MKEYKFQATVQPAGGNGAYILFPFDVQEEFGTNARIPVKASFDGVPYTGSLIKYGNPLHMLPVLKHIREKLRKGPGETVSIVIVRDTSVRSVEVPSDFGRAMSTAKVRSRFDELSYTHRKEYCRWITDAKREQTRQTRIANAVRMLKDGVKSPG